MEKDNKRDLIDFKVGDLLLKYEICFDIRAFSKGIELKDCFFYKQKILMAEKKYGEYPFENSCLARNIRNGFKYEWFNIEEYKNFSWVWDAHFSEYYLHGVYPIDSDAECIDMLLFENLRQILKESNKEYLIERLRGRRLLINEHRE